MADAIITKAELARELDLSRARISQLCKIGLPVRSDGKLNRAEAVAWVKANVCSWRGGWWGNLRQKRTRQTGRRRAPMPAASVSADMDFELPDIDLSDIPRFYDENEMKRAISIAREEGIISAINQLREPENRVAMARMALRFGCTMQQAWAVTEWLELFLAFSYEPEDPERAFLELYDEPDWNRMAADAGTTANVEEWQGWMNRLLEDGEPGKAEA